MRYHSLILRNIKQFISQNPEMTFSEVLYSLLRTVKRNDGCNTHWVRLIADDNLYERSETMIESDSLQDTDVTDENESSEDKNN